MNIRLLRILLIVAACGPALLAQTASLKTDAASVSTAGGAVTFTAKVSYEKTPGALGWAFVIPEGWSLLTVEGTHVPDIAPAVGATGTLEFAYINVPASGATFTFSTCYPEGVGAAKIIPTAIVRTEGKLTELKPATVALPRK